MRRLTILFLLFSNIIFSQSFIQKDTIQEKILKKRILKKYKKKIRHNLSKKESTPIRLIYFMDCSIDTLVKKDTILTVKKIHNELKFKLFTSDDRTLKGKTYYFESLIIEKNKVVASTNLVEQLFCAGVYAKNLYQAMQDFDIRTVFMVYNLKGGNTRKFFVDKNNKIFIYDTYIKKDGNISYTVTAFSKYKGSLVLRPLDGY